MPGNTGMIRINMIKRSRAHYLIFFLFLAVTGCSKSSFESTPEIVPLPAVKTVLPAREIASENVKRKPLLLPQQAPLLQNKALVMIDAGHGGHDTGTFGSISKDYPEKNLTLTTATMLKGYLDAMGYQTVMIRQTDIFIDRYERARIANRKEPKIYVSIHYNFAAEKKAHGIEVFYYQSETDKERSEASKLLGKAILQRVLVQTGAKSRGVKHGNYAVIRETEMPAVIIEGGFLTNDEEMEKLKDPAYLKVLALGIAQGINDYLK